jgi:hypothetical protein
VKPVQKCQIAGTPERLSHVFAGQEVGIKQVDDRIWLVTFMHYDLAYFDDETCRLEPIQNPFGPTVLPMSSAPSVRIVVARLHAVGSGEMITNANGHRPDGGGA